MTDRELMNLAREASMNAYIPYSHFAVGAALECMDGSVYTGCNIENAALGSTLCRQRELVHSLRCLQTVPGGVFSRHGGALLQGRSPLCQL